MPGRAGCGSSHGNCGTITPSHALPLAAPGTIGRALRWMLTPDAPLYIRPRFDPALWAWLAHFAARCNQRDWMRGAAAKAAILQASRAWPAGMGRAISAGLRIRRCGHRSMSSAIARALDEFDADLRALARTRHRHANSSTAAELPARRTGVARRRRRRACGFPAMPACGRTAMSPDSRAHCARRAA